MKLKKSYNEIIKTTYKRYRHFCNNLLKKFKSEYAKNQNEIKKNNNTKLWRTVINITNTIKEKNSATDLIACGN